MVSALDSVLLCRIIGLPVENSRNTWHIFSFSSTSRFGGYFNLENVHARFFVLPKAPSVICREKCYWLKRVSFFDNNATRIRGRRSISSISVDVVAVTVSINLSRIAARYRETGEMAKKTLVF